MNIVLSRAARGGMTENPGPTANSRRPENQNITRHVATHLQRERSPPVDPVSYARILKSQYCRHSIECSASRSICDYYRYRLTVNICFEKSSVASID